MFSKITLMFGISFQLFVSTLSSTQTELKMAMAGNGNAAAVWVTNTLDNMGTNVYVKTKAPSGNWSAATLLSLSTTGDHPNVSIVANGSDALAVAFWSENDGDVAYLYGAMLPSLEGAWTTATKISGSNENLSNNFYISLTNPNPNSTALAVWSSYDDLGNPLISNSTATVDSNNSWSIPTVIGP